MSYELVRSPERLGQIANEINDSLVIGFDIETTGYNKNVPGSTSSPFKDDIRIFSVNTGSSTYVIDLYETKTLGPVVNALAESKAVKCIQNAKFEQKWLLQKYDVELWPIFDTFRASALLHNGLGLPQDLYSLYERELKIAPPTRDMGGEDWAGTLTQEHYDYAASDVAYLHQLRDSLKPKLAAKGLNKIALIEFGSILPESAVELNGFPLDKDAWLKLAEQNEIKAKQLRSELIWELPNPKTQMTLLGFEPDLNLDSTKQMLASLRQLGIQQECEECRGRGRTREGECGLCEGEGIVQLQNTREMTLAMHAAEFPVIKKLLEYRDYSKRLASFGPEYIRHINPITGRIHSDFYPFTEAGRFSCSKPNLQQIHRDEAFRRCFKAPPGKKFRLADYSNIEMRLVAEIANDPVLIDIFRRNEDAHYATAALLLGIPREKAKELVTKLQRQQAKPVNFGFCLVPGTQIVTSVGPKNIEDMQVGDFVLTHMGRWKPVVEIQVAETDRIIRITTSTGKIVECTADHGWMTFDSKRVEELYKWIKAGELSLGDFLCADTNEKIVSIDTDRYTGTVHDITVEDDHSFVANSLISMNCYGMQARKMVLYAQSNYGVSLTLKQSEEFRRKFFAPSAYARIAEWHQEQLELGSRTHMVRTLGGRLRYLAEDAHNEFFNTGPQGSGADGLKAALREVYMRFKKYSKWNGPIKMIHHVHDEIITETPDDDEIGRVVEKDLSEGMHDGMAQFMKKVPVVAEAASGYSWADK